jgi:hypothetical protein
MRSRLSILGALFVLVLIGSVVSCSNTDSPTTDGSTLIVPQDTVRLTATNPIDTLHLKLSCGCGFTMSVSGDTSVIKCDAMEAMDNTLSDHNLILSYSPSSTTGSHSVTFDFLAHKHTYSYTNKVMVIAGP